ncbi:MAG: 3-mercaptopyruvate sulfurtransferase [Methylococcaceae bacterium]|nr:3-mercaptopyruvate sulfurtransferase [Methylococcaceae bacterium]
MPNAKYPPLVGVDWLAEKLGSPEVSLLDASFFLPNQNRNALEEYRQNHIPGAQFFDIDEVADHSVKLPHMLPSPERFAEGAGALGIGGDSHVIVYDNNFFMASARLWWTFRVFGHDKVSVLDGGLARWKQEGKPVNADAVSPPARTFKAGFRPELVRKLEQVKALLDQPEAQILDARSPGRFAGAEPEPRAGLRSGHIPGSFNLFFKSLVDEASFRLKPASELTELYHQAGIDISRPVVTTCGTGVTASVLALGLYLLGNETAAVYDGSWTEWGGLEDVPVHATSIGPA